MKVLEHTFWDVTPDLIILKQEKELFSQAVWETTVASALWQSTCSRQVAVIL